MRKGETIQEDKCLYDPLSSAPPAHPPAVALLAWDSTLVGHSIRVHPQCKELALPMDSQTARQPVSRRALGPRLWLKVPGDGSAMARHQCFMRCLTGGASLPVPPDSCYRARSPAHSHPHGHPAQNTENPLQTWNLLQTPKFRSWPDPSL